MSVLTKKEAMEVSSAQETPIIPMPMPLNQTPSLTKAQIVPFTKNPIITTSYKECLKNHAAAMGTTAIDGCIEFLPGGEDSLACAACTCHRNFHRKELTTAQPPTTYINAAAATITNYHHYNMIMPPSNSYGQERMMMMKKKRFRTKFTEEQKEMMAQFAERVGWRMPKLPEEESAVQQFCQEVGVKRGVLKVWMHNHKHHYVNNNISNGLNSNNIAHES